jgi:hypothetical protein
MRVRTETIEEPLYLAKFAGRPGYELTGKPRRWRKTSGFEEADRGRKLTERLSELNRDLEASYLHVEPTGRVIRTDPDDHGPLTADEVKKELKYHDRIGNSDLKDALRAVGELKKIRERREPALPGFGPVPVKSPRQAGTRPAGLRKKAPEKATGKLEPPFKHRDYTIKETKPVAGYYGRSWDVLDPTGRNIGGTISDPEKYVDSLIAEKEAHDKKAAEKEAMQEREKRQWDYTRWQVTPEHEKRHGKETAQRLMYNSARLRQYADKLHSGTTVGMPSIFDPLDGGIILIQSEMINDVLNGKTPERALADADRKRSDLVKNWNERVQPSDKKWMRVKDLGAQRMMRSMPESYRRGDLESEKVRIDRVLSGAPPGKPPQNWPGAGT